MRTIRIKLYKFSELSETAKQTAIENYRCRQQNSDNFHYYDEILDSAKKAIELFDLKTGNEYSDIRTSHIDDAILELKGVRLYKYLVNNYGNELFKPTYIRSLDKEFRCNLFICKVRKNHKGEPYTQIYSKTKKDNSCTLTGTCYDMNILKPIYDFLKKPSANTSFDDLMQSIGNAISKTYSDMEERVNSDEFITESILANEYEFTITGERF